MDPYLPRSRKPYRENYRPGMFPERIYLNDYLHPQRHPAASVRNGTQYHPPLIRNPEYAGNLERTCTDPYAYPERRYPTHSHPEPYRRGPYGRDVPLPPDPYGHPATESRFSQGRMNRPSRMDDHARNSHLAAENRSFPLEYREGHFNGRRDEEPCPYYFTDREAFGVLPQHKEDDWMKATSMMMNDNFLTRRNYPREHHVYDDGRISNSVYSDHSSPCFYRDHDYEDYRENKNGRLRSCNPERRFGTGILPDFPDSRDSRTDVPNERCSGKFFHENGDFHNRYDAENPVICRTCRCCRQKSLVESKETCPPHCPPQFHHNENCSVHEKDLHCDESSFPGRYSSKASHQRPVKENNSNSCTLKNTFDASPNDKKHRCFPKMDSKDLKNKVKLPRPPIAPSNQEKETEKDETDEDPPEPVRHRSKPKFRGGEDGRSNTRHSKHKNNRMQLRSSSDNHSSTSSESSNDETERPTMAEHQKLNTRARVAANKGHQTKNAAKASKSVDKQCSTSSPPRRGDFTVYLSTVRMISDQHQTQMAQEDSPEEDSGEEDFEKKPSVGRPAMRKQDLAKLNVAKKMMKSVFVADKGTPKESRKVNISVKTQTLDADEQTIHVQTRVSLTPTKRDKSETAASPEAKTPVRYVGNVRDVFYKAPAHPQSATDISYPEHLPVKPELYPLVQKDVVRKAYNVFQELKSTMVSKGKWQGK